MITSAFKNDQFDSLYPEGVERHYWSRARSEIIITFLKQQNIQDRRMLEIGCGKGVVVRALRDAHFDCLGVDIANIESNPRVHEYVWTNMNFTELSVEIQNSVQVVLLFDVIEHIEDEQKFLETIRNTFPNLTHVVCTVPACMTIWSNFDTYNGHYRRYTKDSLRMILKKSGFITGSIKYFFHALYIPARLCVLCGVVRKTHVNVPNNFMAKVHACIAWCFVAEYRVVSSNILGTSLISIMTLEK